MSYRISQVLLKKETVQLRLKERYNRTQSESEKRSGGGCIIEWLSFNKAPLTLHCSSPIFSSTDILRSLLLSDNPLFSSTRSNVTLTHWTLASILPYFSRHYPQGKFKDSLPLAALLVLRYLLHMFIRTHFIVLFDLI